MNNKTAIAIGSAVLILLTLSYMISAYFLLMLLIFPLFLVWAFSMIFIPWPPYRSPLMKALNNAYEKERATRDRWEIFELRNPSDFIPVGMTIQNSGLLLRRAGFKLANAEYVDEKEAESWGVNCDQLKKYQRLTHVHPFAHFGWTIYVFHDRDCIVRDVRARPFFLGP